MDAYLERQICARIRTARKNAGFTQADLANLLNVTLRAYQNYERDRVPFRRLEEIAKLCAVDQEWLLRGDPPLSQEDSGLLSDVAEAVATLEQSQESVHAKLDQALALLAELAAAQSPPADVRSQRRPNGRTSS